MAVKYFPRLKFLFWPFEIRNGTSALACLPRIKGEPPHSADKARKPSRRQDSKLRLRCDDSELDAAHVGIIILVDVAVVIALIAPKGGGSCSNKSSGSGCSTSPLGGSSYMTYLSVCDWGMASMRKKWMRLEKFLLVEEKREFV